MLNQGGLIDLAGGRGTAGNRLTIIGDYAGQAGTVLLRTVAAMIRSPTAS